MTDIGFRVVGHLPSDLLPADARLKEAERVVNRHLQDIVTKGQTYPPPRPGSKYKRTYVLRDSWHMQPAHFDGANLRGSAYNTANRYGTHYASFVYGSTEHEQHPVHAGRWPSRDQLFDRHALDAELDAIFGR